MYLTWMHIHDGILKYKNRIVVNIVRIVFKVYFVYIKHIFENEKCSLISKTKFTDHFKKFRL